MILLNSNDRDRKKDIIYIWKSFPYLGDVRDTNLLNYFANYKIYEDEIKLMAQMRIILMSEYSYKNTKTYIESIMHNDSMISQFVEDATEFYITHVKPKYEGKKSKLEYYTESIVACMKKNIMSNDDVKIF